jgi:hypothetical protein
LPARNRVISSVAGKFVAWQGEAVSAGSVVNGRMLEFVDGETVTLWLHKCGKLLDTIYITS